MKYYIGIDLGGTNIAVGIVDENNRIVAKKSVPTNAPRAVEAYVDDMIKTTLELCESTNIALRDVEWIGVGSPGSVNPVSGTVERAHNLGITSAPVAKLIEEKTSVKCFIENDANAAAYGEFIAGAAKDATNAVCVTIGTGVGGGIIINGKIYSGSNFCGAEMGHCVIEYNGLQCNCGRKGCLERYCSATALIEQTKAAMTEHSDSAMWDQCGGNIDDVNGRTAFDAMKKGDKSAKEVVEGFTGYLACGCANFINIFQPDVLLIGGGISKEGETLLKPLRDIVKKEAFNGDAKNATKIVAASLGNDAGIIGAAMLGLLYN